MELAGTLGTPLGLAQRKRASPRGEAQRYCGPVGPATKLSPPHICDQATCDQGVVDNSETQPAFSPSNPTAHTDTSSQKHTHSPVTAPSGTPQGSPDHGRGTAGVARDPEGIDSSIAPYPVESREAPPISTVSLTSPRHSEKLLEATGKSRGK